MKKIRTLVVDDEPLARARIVKLLNAYPYIQLIGECKNGGEAITQIENYKPELVFLDIQMPDLNGFDVLAKTKIRPLPFIIFVTAYNQYALKAFDIHAVDYLLKPFDDERFENALEHAYQQIQLRQYSLLHKKMTNLIQSFNAPSENQLVQIAIKEKGRTIHLMVEDIFYFETHGNYLKVHLKERNHLIRKTLQAVEDQLNPQRFLRIHRSILLNTNYINKIQYTGNNQYQFFLKNGNQLLSSRTFKTQIDDYLETESWKKNLSS